MSTTVPSRPATEGSLRPETVKHYLETIFYIQFEEDRVRPGRIAEWLGLRPPTVSVTLHRLERDGWIDVGADRTVSLTDEGMALASGVVRVHRLLERWLTDVLGFDWATRRQLRAGDRAGHVGRGRRTPGRAPRPPFDVSPRERRSREHGSVRRSSSRSPNCRPGRARACAGSPRWLSTTRPTCSGGWTATAWSRVRRSSSSTDGSSEDALTVDIGDRRLALGMLDGRA